MIRIVQEFDLPTGGVLNLNEPLAANHLVVFYDKGGQGFPDEVLANGATVNATGNYLGSAIGGSWSVAYGSFKPNYAVLGAELLTQLTWGGYVHGWIFENAATLNGIFAGDEPMIGSGDIGGKNGIPCMALTAAQAASIPIQPPTDYAFCVLFLSAWCSSPANLCGVDPVVFLQASGTTGNNEPSVYATQIDGWGEIIQTDTKVYRVTSNGDPTFLHGDISLGYFVTEAENIKVSGDCMFFVVTPLDDPLDQTIITDNMIWETEGDGINVEGVAGITVTRNNLSYTHGTGISLLNLTAPIVENNTIYLPDNYGIFIQGVTDAIIRNNVLNEVSQHNAGVYPYINIGSSSHRAQVIGNRLVATGPKLNGIQLPQTGIVINAGVQETALVTNDLRGALYGSETWADVCVDNGGFTTLINNLPGGEFSVSAPSEYTGPVQPDPILGVLEINPLWGGFAVIPDDPDVGTLTTGNSLDMSYTPGEDEDFNNYYRFTESSAEGAWWTVWAFLPVPQEVWTGWDERDGFWNQYPNAIWTVPFGVISFDVSRTELEQADEDAYFEVQEVRYGTDVELLSDLDLNPLDYYEHTRFGANTGWGRTYLRIGGSGVGNARTRTLRVKIRVFAANSADIMLGRIRIPYVKGFVGYTTEYGGTPVPKGSGSGNTTIVQPSLTQENVEDFAAAMLTGGTHSGIAFTYNDTPGTISATVTGGAAGTLDGLTDVTITTPADTDILTYDNGVWVNAPAGTVATPLDGLADVDAAAPNDGDLLGFNSGSGNWEAVAAPAGGGLPWFPTVTTPVLSDFAWVTQGTATATEQHAGITLWEPGHSGTSARILKKAAPTAPYTITAGFLVSQWWAKTYNMIGLCFRDSASGNLQTFSLLGQGGAPYWVSVDAWTSDTSYLTQYSAQSYGYYGPVIWMRLVDDNANKSYQWSGDGFTWTKMYEHARTTMFTPNEVGFFVDAWNTSTPNRDVAMHLVHWSQA